MDYSATLEFELQSLLLSRDVSPDQVAVLVDKLSSIPSFEGLTEPLLQSAIKKLLPLVVATADDNARWTAAKAVAGLRHALQRVAPPRSNQEILSCLSEMFRDQGFDYFVRASFVKSGCQHPTLIVEIVDELNLGGQRLSMPGLAPGDYVDFCLEDETQDVPVILWEDRAQQPGAFSFEVSSDKPLSSLFLSVTAHDLPVGRSSLAKIRRDSELRL